MAHSSRSTVALCLIAALATALHGWLQVAERAGYSPAPVLERVFCHGELERFETGQQRVAATVERHRRTEELATDVADGRIPLREGAARLRELFRATPDFPWHAVERKYPGISDEERCCRLLIAEVGKLEHRNPEQAQAAMDRLEADYSREFRHTSPATATARQESHGKPSGAEAVSRSDGNHDRPTSTAADRT